MAVVPFWAQESKKTGKRHSHFGKEQVWADCLDSNPQLCSLPEAQPPDLKAGGVDR